MLNKNRFWVVVPIIVIVLAGGVFYWYAFLYGKVSTDNAYVLADSATVSSRIPGNVLSIHVQNDTLVKEGDLLLELDPTDYSLQLRQAEANLERLKAEVRAMEVELELTERTSESNYKGAMAGVRQAREQKRRLEELLGELREKKRAVEAELELASKEHLRVSNLYENGVVPKRTKDLTDKTYTQAKAQLASVEAEIQAALKGILAAEREIERQEALLKKAMAELKTVDLKKEKLEALKAQEKESIARYELARQNLFYCKVVAPISGQVAQKRVQVGDRVNPGQALLAIVPLHKVYVEANFKETQVEKIRPGMEAFLWPDMYPKVKLKGKVTSLRAGTGAAFSLLPPENATGNWIKVVQRIPVRIELEGGNPKDTPLRVGSSVRVTVYTKRAL